MNRRDALTTVALAGVAVAASLDPGAAEIAPANSALERIKRTGVLRVAVIVGQEPYFHKDLPTGQWSGACIDMANDIASKLSAKVEVVESTWGNQILDLQGDKVDIAFAVNPTPERALVIDFSTPILVHSFTVITRKGFAKPSMWEEINKPEVKIAIDIGSTHDLIARRYCPKATILGFKTRDEAILAVATGRADCNVSLAVLAVSTLKKNPTLGEMSIPRPADVADQHGNSRRTRPPLQGFPERLGRLQPFHGPDPGMDAQGFRFGRIDGRRYPRRSTVLTRDVCMGFRGA